MMRQLTTVYMADKDINTARSGSILECIEAELSTSFFIEVQNKIGGRFYSVMFALKYSRLDPLEDL